MDRAIKVARFTQVMRRWVCAAAVLSSSRISGTKVHRTYVGRLERGESGVTVEALAAILAALGMNLKEFLKPFTKVMMQKTARGRQLIASSVTFTRRRAQFLHFGATRPYV